LATKAVEVLADEAGADCVPFVLDATQYSNKQEYARKVLETIGVDAVDGLMAGLKRPVEIDSKTKPFSEFRFSTIDKEHPLLRANHYAIGQGKSTAVRSEISAHMIVSYRTTVAEGSEDAAIVAAFFEPRIQAAEVLAEIQPEGISALEKALQDQDADVRCLAAWGLGHVRKGAEPFLPALIAAMRDPEKRVRVFAAFAMLRLGVQVRGEVAALKQQLDDQDDYVSMVCREVIQRLSGNEPPKPNETIKIETR
jgi:hypothetical protein